jgi:quercetin dioxygenase-like cupin family protein
MTIAAAVRPDRKVSWMGANYSITVAKTDSAGHVGVFESIVPAGDGPPIHIHHNEDEVIHVIDGEFEFWLDGAITHGSPGSSVFVPRGVPHTFRVVGDKPGRALAMLTPGGFEQFFLDVAARDLKIPENMPDVVAVAARYGLEFIGPAAWDGTTRHVLARAS